MNRIETGNPTLEAQIADLEKRIVAEKATLKPNTSSETLASLNSQLREAQRVIADMRLKKSA